MTDTEDTDVSRITVGEKEVVLIGTAHISQTSVETVQRVIEQEAPDVVGVELDEERVKALRDQPKWESLNLVDIIKNKQLLFLTARLALMAFQKRMGSYTGVKPGAEMVAAMEVAEAAGAEVVLCDRNVRTTLLRAWRKTSFWKRASVAATLLAGVFERIEISENELAELRETQNISAVLDELGDALPSVKSVLVDERDMFMAQKIKDAPGKKMVVVIGAAHKPGILRNLERDLPAETIAEIDTVPPKSRVTKFLPWIIPAVVVALFVVGFFYGDPTKMEHAALAWILANGILSALGAIIALGHPLTVIAAFIAAPITSLNPTIGAGMVTALVQTFVASPSVRDMENIGDDIVTVKGWWTNRLARVLLVFILSNLGSAIGTFVAFGWLKSLL